MEFNDIEDFNFDDEGVTPAETPSPSGAEAKASPPPPPPTGQGAKTPPPSQGMGAKAPPPPPPQGTGAKMPPPQAQAQVVAQGGQTQATLQAQQQLQQQRNIINEMHAQIQALQNQLAVSQVVAAKEKVRSEDLSNLANRMQADFDNYRKRTNETVKRSEQDGLVKVVEKLLPVMDIFKHAVMMITDEKTAEGVKMIYRQLTELLSSFGIEEISALGEKFDPELHNAVAQVKIKDKDKTGIIVEVFQKGYRLGDRIIRHSVVKVAN